MDTTNTTVAIYKAGERTEKAFKDTLVRGKKVVTRKTINSLERVTRPFSFRITANKSLQYIQYGRKANGKLPVFKKGNKFFLFPDLAAWKKTVGYTGSGYMLAKGIAKRGIKPYDVFAKVQAAVSDKNEQELATAFKTDIITSSVLDAKKAFKGV